MDAGSNKQVIGSFVTVQAEMSQLGGKLAAWEANGHIYPEQSVSDSFQCQARELDDATQGLKALHPEHRDLLANLKSDTLAVARNSGLTSAMADHASTFASGWASTMDRPVQDAQQAIQAALDPAQGSCDEKPTPAEAVTRFASLSSDLSGLQGKLSSWAANGHTYPEQNVATNLDDLASRLYDARSTLQALHPEQQDLISRLGGDMLSVSRNAGTVDYMADHQSTFSSGWNILTGPSNDVQQAIGLMAT